MQFILNGPEVPEDLIDAHERGEVIFFCGAGISYQANLPGFKGLVDKIYEELHEDKNKLENDAYRKGQYDTTLDLFEKRIELKHKIRRAIEKVLQFDPSIKDALGAHKSILTLSRVKNSVKLITTNFDRIFEYIIKTDGLTVDRYVAPLLPVPKHSKWNGIVYLHGLLPEIPNDYDLNRLIISSSDFGLAYIVERWGSIFLSEVFKNYSICFVGYSINDPIMRYIMDAIGADQRDGESKQKFYAFGGYASNKKQNEIENWKSKNVIPILYKVKRNNNHCLLYDTLKEWASVYKDGILGKTSLIRRYAKFDFGTHIDDGRIGRVLWALKDQDGIAARAFVQADPPLEWLEVFEKNNFDQLGNLFNENSVGNFNIDTNLINLCEWLVNNMEKVEVINFVINHGSYVNSLFKFLAAKKINLLNKNSYASAVWNILLNNGAFTGSKSGELLYWKNDYDKFGWSVTLKSKLLYFLQPKVNFNAHYFVDKIKHKSESGYIDFISSFTIVPNAGPDSIYMLKDILSDLKDKECVCDMLLSTTLFLEDVLRLKTELKEIDHDYDLTYIERPSINFHSQNEQGNDWTILIDYCVESWVAAKKFNLDLAKQIAKYWIRIDYPLFRRLLFFSAVDIDIFQPKEALDCLLIDGGRWIWSSCTKREASLLVKSLVPRLDASEQNTLLKVLLEGPPRKLYKTDLQDDEFNDLKENQVNYWVKKFIKSGGSASDNSLEKYISLTDVDEDLGEKDEFPFWIESGTPDIKLNQPFNIKEIITYIRGQGNVIKQTDDTWNAVCSKVPYKAIGSLIILSRQDYWPTNFWDTIFWSFSRDDFGRRSWKFLSKLLMQAPKSLLEKNSNSLSSLLFSFSSAINCNKDIFFKLIDIVLDKHIGDKFQDDERIVTRAINHPVGKSVEAIINWWYHDHSYTERMLPVEVKNVLDRMCEPENDICRFGRVVISASLIQLYNVEPEWASRRALHFFDWDHNNIDAKVMWQGFLWKNKISLEVLDKLKYSMLKTVKNYDKLGSYKRSFISMLTLSCLEYGHIISIYKMKGLLKLLPSQGLECVSKSLLDFYSATPTKEYWGNRVKRFIAYCFPIERRYRNGSISRHFATICILNADIFEEVFANLKDYLCPAIYGCSIFEKMYESKIHQKFPEKSLEFLSIVINNDDKFPGESLVKIIKDIEAIGVEWKMNEYFLIIQSYLVRIGMLPLS